MRFTGTILFGVAALAAVVCLGFMVFTQTGQADVGSLSTERDPGNRMTIPLVASGVVMLVGALMYFLGGKGYAHVQNPAIRN